MAIAIAESDLATLEATIERGLATFVEVGEALARIRDERLYAGASYATFEQYLRGRWDMARQTGYDYINAAEVAANLQNGHVRAPVQSLTQGVLLHRLEPEQQVALASSLDLSHVPTRQLAALVRGARGELGSRKAPSIPKLPAAGHQQHLHVQDVPRRVAKFYVGDVREVLGRLEPEFAQCVMTSPPFWGLRDYKIPPAVWGQTCCDHEHTWEDAPWKWNPGGNDEGTSTLSGGGQHHQKKVGHKAGMGAFCSHVHDWQEVLKPAANGIVNSAMQGETFNETSATRRPTTSALCQCGAWYGQLGLEPWPGLYVEHIVEAFRAVWRALRNDGVLWLEIGDSYAGSGKGPTGWSGIGNHDERQGFVGSGQKSHSKVGWSTVRAYEDGRRAGFGDHHHDYRAKRSERDREPGIKPKDLLGIPWRVAFALQADGWYLRNDNVWNKPNPMPESMKDRSTRAHSYVFQFAKRRRFYYDWLAVAEPTSGNAHSRGNGSSPKADLDEFVVPGQRDNNQQRVHRSPAAKASILASTHAMSEPVSQRNKRSVWTIPTRPFPGAHFACVDEQTEALTIDGWRRHDEVSDGMLIAAYDQRAEGVRWEPATFHRYAYDGEMVALDKRDTSQVLTPNHRCLVRRRGGWIGVVQADALRAGMEVRTAASWLPDEWVTIGSNWAALLGWYIAEGHSRYAGRVYIYQSETANPLRVARIRQLLQSVGATFDERHRSRQWRGRESHEVEFVVTGDVATRLQELAPTKTMTPALAMLAEPDAKALLGALIEGDGHRRGDGRECIVQKDKASIDAMQMLALRLGYRAHVSPRQPDGYTLYLTRGEWLTLRGTNGSHDTIFTRGYRGTVWCPSVPSSFWLARRNGKPFITGNTFPTELVDDPIKATTSERGQCPECGAPWARLIRKAGEAYETVGWQPTCKHYDKRYRDDFDQARRDRKRDQRHISGDWWRRVRRRPGLQDWPTVAQTVLDPFSGAGTVALVAARRGRDSVGIDAKESYVRMAEKRLLEDAPMLVEVQIDP